MYKLILVDDEEDVREGLTQEIGWEQFGFEVVGTAENGKEAYELIERLVPDVIVSDIMMPFLDGLSLAKLVRENYPDIKIILLTGFDEFEYAKKAVTLQIEEYVLKPFSSQELIDAIVKVKSQIDAEMAEKENIHQLLQHYKESLPILRNSFLTSLITKRFEQSEVIEKLNNYSISLHGNLFTVSAVRIDQLFPLHAGSNGQESRHHAGDESGDREFQLFAVLNLAEEICNKRGMGLTFLHNDHVVVLTASSEDKTNTAIEKTLTLLEEIRLTAEKHLKFSITIGVGTVTSNVTSLKDSYEEALIALDYRLILGNNRIIYIADIENRTVEKPKFDEQKEQDLIRYIKMGSLSEIKGLIESFFHEIESAKISYKDYQIYLLEILITILKMAQNSSRGTDPILDNHGILFSEMQKLNNLQEAKNWILDLCQHVMSSIETDRLSNSKNLVHLAKKYIQEHYHESDINVTKVCHHLHISSGYFSYIFKKEMKATFLNYLLKIRMEAAKDLLGTTDFKSFEVAEKVGYSEPNYFSFCFKKYYGLTPKELRSKFREVRP
jgi:two-component system, response regulator YesN